MRVTSTFPVAILSFALGAGLVQGCPRAPAPPAHAHVRPSVATDFSPDPHRPVLATSAYVYDDAVVIGSVELGERVLLAPHAFLRGDEGQHIRIGDDSNVQDCAGVHALESVEQDERGHWHSLPGRLFTADGRRIETALHGAEALDAGETAYAVWIGKRVSVAHQALVHGPAWVGDDTFVGMQAQVFQAKVGRGCVLAPRAFVMGVDIPEGRLVGPGVNVLTQEAADALPPVRGSAFERLNRAVVHVNTELAEKYSAQARAEPR